MYWVFWQGEDLEHIGCRPWGKITGNYVALSSSPWMMDKWINPQELQIIARAVVFPADVLLCVSLLWLLLRNGIPQFRRYGPRVLQWLLTETFYLQHTRTSLPQCHRHYQQWVLDCRSRSSRSHLCKCVLSSVESVYGWEFYIQMCTMPQQFVFTLIEFPLDSLYLVSLLSNLNARSYIRGNPAEWSEYLSSLKIAQRNT